MRIASLLFAFTLCVPAQDIFEQGAQVFKLTCAQGYCHGSGGTQGRAPKLIGRNYEQAFVLKAVQEGIPNTGMPAFKNNLESGKLNAVVAYVLKISGGDTSKVGTMATGAAMEALPADAKKGKELFFDAYRGVNRCATCHSLEGMGVPIGPNLATAGPYPKTVRLATVKSGDTFPALVVEQKPDTIRLYDLTVPPPVLRTLAKSDVTLSGGSGWSHANAARKYSDAEMASIATYLKWVQTH